jgi:negative regulator of flagellin synthesis FlgM
MQIYGPTQVHAAQSIAAPHAPRAAQPLDASSAAQITDEVQFSPASQFVADSHMLPAVRQDRIDAIRAELAAGTYLTDARLDIALDRLLDEIG